MKTRTSRRAFTLIEVLTVVGVIVLLVAILLPALNKARKSAKVVATSNTLETITTALTAYEQDFLGYLPPATESDSPVNGTNAWGRPGFAALGLSLLGPGGSSTLANGKAHPSAPQFDATKSYDIGDCVSDGTRNYLCIAATTSAPPNPAGWQSLTLGDPFDQGTVHEYYDDQKDGPGIKAGAKTFGPYVAPERIHARGAAFLDSWDHPIGYFPVHFKGANIRKFADGGKGPATAQGRIGTYTGLTVQSKYDPLDNWQLFVWPNETQGQPANAKSNCVQRIQVMLGDRNCNGIIDNYEKPIEDRPYILWSAGPDERFGVQNPSSTNANLDSDVNHCDDIIK